MIIEEVLHQRWLRTIGSNSMGIMLLHYPLIQVVKGLLFLNYYFNLNIPCIIVAAIACLISLYLSKCVLPLVNAAAERTRLYRNRKAAVEALREGGMEELWSCIKLFEGYIFHTATGLKYTYTVHGGELFISRKEKSVTKASVEKAYRKVMDEGWRVYNNPKDLGDIFGISYIYPLFYRFGLIDVPEKVKVKMK